MNEWLNDWWMSYVTCWRYSRSILSLQYISATVSLPAIRHIHNICGLSKHRWLHISCWPLSEQPCCVITPVFSIYSILPSVKAVYFKRGSTYFCFVFLFTCSRHSEIKENLQQVFSNYKYNIYIIKFTSQP